MNHDKEKKQPNKKQAPHVYGEFFQDKWVSLADALWNPGVSVAALATFIEKNNIKAIDPMYRIIAATDGDEHESTSKASALNLLILFCEEEDAYHERDPGANPSRWQEYDSPMHKFGWTKDEVPDDPDDFAMWISNSLPESKKPSSSQNKDPDDWKEQARQIADELFDRDTKLKTRDCLIRINTRGECRGGYAYRVMEIMQKREIHGPRGRIDNARTIAREALQGDRWWGKKPK